MNSGGLLSELERYKASDFISIFQKFKLAFNLLVSNIFADTNTFLILEMHVQFR